MKNIIERRIRKRMDKKGMGAGVIAIILIGLVVAAIVVYGMFIYTPTPGGITGGGGVVVGTCPTACPDDTDWSGTTYVENSLNSTGTELFNVTTYFTNVETGEVKDKLTATSGQATTLTCGETYKVELVSASGAGGDSGAITGAPSGASLNADGSATFTACGGGSEIVFKADQHGLPKIRAKDLVDDAFMYQETGGEDKTPSATDGELFYSSTNGTCIAVGSGGNLHFVEYVKANVEDEDVNDLGTYVLIDAAVSTWAEPNVKIDGSSVSNMKSSLNADEIVAYSDYEYVYKVDASKDVYGSTELSVDVNIDALSGQDPTGAHNLSIDYAPIGRYESKQNTNVVKIGAVDDSSGRSQVHTLHDTVVCVG